MKKLVLILVFAALGFINLYAVGTEKMMLSGTETADEVFWDFYCTSGRKSGQWSKNRVPSCWELEGFGTYNYGYERNKADEKGIYRTRFSLPEDWRDKRIFIVFEGAMTDALVKVNGRQAGEVHQGAFYRFKREISELVVFGEENELEAEVSKMSANASVNSAERDADFWVFGGIFRPVYLEAVPKTHLEQVGIDAKHDGSVLVEAFVDQPLKQAELEVSVYGLSDGKLVGHFVSEAGQAGNKIVAKSVLSDISPWTAETPHLYFAQVTLKDKGKVLHTVKERFGFRTIELRERDGVYVNNVKVRFKGVNRHCFWPTTGRSVSPAQSLQDVLLIKEMNMNAVRAAHYPPDKHFLELCDSLGLYVINELCTWQKPTYDTQVGSILVKEMIHRDQNHPSIIFWANGNEGGFNRELDSLYKEFDTQQRPVIHPFGLFGGINTTHYISYNSGIKNMFNGRDVFMPTELLHGLYDGGHGAGLDDFWNLMLDNPLSAGLFLWDFSDQGVVRTDRGGELDTDGASGADGILGPYREKEGSFYTIKEIWSPVFVEQKFVSPQWDGVLNLENRYEFSNTSSCAFSFWLKRFDALDKEVVKQGALVEAPNIEPGDKGKLRLDLPNDWIDYDVLYLQIDGPDGRELFTWSFELSHPDVVAQRILKKGAVSDHKASVDSQDSAVEMSAAGVTVRFSRETGMLLQVRNEEGVLPLSNGPFFINDSNIQCTGVKVQESPEGMVLDATYVYPNNWHAYSFKWTLHKNGVLQLDYRYRPGDKLLMSGISFDFPEEGVEGARLLAKGPYRVYNNRLKGGVLDVWDKAYNDAITGEVWEYPEFKGYYALFYGMELLGEKSFKVYSGSEDLFLHLFTPSIQALYDPAINYTQPSYPGGQLSFLDAIPAVGTKFQTAENYGPQSQLHRFKGFSETPDMINRLYFDFRKH